MIFLLGNYMGSSEIVPISMDHICSTPEACYVLPLAVFLVLSLTPGNLGSSIPIRGLITLLKGPPGRTKKIPPTSPQETSIICLNSLGDTENPASHSHSTVRKLNSLPLHCWPLYQTRGPVHEDSCNRPPFA